MLEEIRKIVLAQLPDQRAAAELDYDDDLWEWGITSIGNVGVVIAVEDTFGIEFPDDVLNRQTFSSIRSIGRAVLAVQGKPDEVVA
jgi:acyl carrier protein